MVQVAVLSSMCQICIKSFPNKLSKEIDKAYKLHILGQNQYIKLKPVRFTRWYMFSLHCCWGPYFVVCITNL